MIKDKIHIVVALITFSFLLLITSDVMAQGIPSSPLSVPCLDSLPQYFTSSSICITVNPLCRGDSTVSYQYKMHILGEEVEYTSFIGSYKYTFMGFEDGDTVLFWARAKNQTDTSNWSDRLQTIVDLKDPDNVQEIHLQQCRHGGRHTVKLRWKKAHDSASGIEKYQVLRATTRGKLTVIDGAETVVAEKMHSDGQSWYGFEDDGPSDSYIDYLTPGETYWYTVVPYDYVGNFPGDDNIIDSVTIASTPPPSFPLCSRLEDLPRYIETEICTVKIDLDACSFDLCNETRYKFQRWVEGDSASTVEVTDWQIEPQYAWVDMEECVTYNFAAKAKRLSDLWESTWTGPLQSTMSDRNGPIAVSSINVEIQSGPQIRIEVVSPGDTLMDCGAGIKEYHLFRFKADDVGDAYADGKLDMADAEYIVHTWKPKGKTEYVWSDDAPSDPAQDLEAGECYYYAIGSIDSLDHYSSEVLLSTDVCLPGIVTPCILLPLKDWTKGTSVALTMIDTSRCTAARVAIERSLYSNFSELDTSFEYDIHHAALNNPDDANCSDRDTLTFVFRNCGENRYYFRVFCIDAFGSVSEYSNKITTRLDNSPPAAPVIAADGIKSVADSTREVNITLQWAPVFDYGIGFDYYVIYRSGTSGELGDSIGSVTSEFYEDENPSDINYFRENYYTIGAVDKFGQESLSKQQVFLEANEPPAIPQIDTAWIGPARNKIYIRWSDTSSLATYPAAGLNKYVVEHAAEHNWLYLGDPILVDIEAPARAKCCTLQFDEFFSGSYEKYIQIKAIDIFGNESGYSELGTLAIDTSLIDIYELHLYKGWNLISIPVMPRTREISTLLPGVIAVYEYAPETQSYITPAFIEQGKAYWVLANTEREIEIAGFPLLKYKMTLLAGWNIIGGLFDSGVFSVEPPNSIIESNIYYYNSISGSYLYLDSNSLETGVGYWMLAKDNCELTVSTESSSKKMNINSMNNRVWTASISVDGQELYFGVDQDATSGYDESIDMQSPPPLPSGEDFPTLVSSDGLALLESYVNSEASVWNVEVPDYSLIEWSNQQLPNTGTFTLLDLGENIAIDMRSKEFIRGSGNFKIIYSPDAIDEELPYVVEKKPNPFRNSTDIKFWVPEERSLTIQVIDLSGRRVNKLAQRQFPEGFHTIQWDGNGLNGERVSGGIYFLQIKSNNHSLYEKMILLN